MRKLFIIGMTLIFSSAASAQDTGGYTEGYICKPEMAAGFSFNENLKRWEIANFSSDKKYLIVPTPKEGELFGPESIPWIVRISGKTGFYPEATCERDFDKDGFLNCEIARDNVFKFNNKNLRFIRTEIDGYHDGNLPEFDKRWNDYFAEHNPEIEVFEGSRTPLIEIGTCTKF